MYLETIVPTSETTSRVFKMDRQELQRKSVTTLFKKSNESIMDQSVQDLFIVSILRKQRWR